MENMELPSREDFDRKLLKIISEKKSKDNLCYMDRDQYDKFLEETRRAKIKKDSTKAFRRLHRFDICTIDGEDKLIAPLKEGETMKFYATTEELYDILTRVHLDLQHGGRNRMLPLVKEKYKNVGVEAIMTYLQLCGICLAKKKTTRRGLTVKPMVFKELNDRVQVDLIDFQSKPDGEYKFIFVAQDHLTKFTHLRPLVTKTAAEVTENLLDVFLVFGAPTVLQADNGREFANKLVKELRQLWPGLHIVHGESSLRNRLV